MKILLVESNTATVRHLQDLLSKDYVVDPASGVEEAIGQTALVQYRLIIIGLELLDTNDITACMLMRKHKITLPLLKLTENSKMPVIVQALDSGADACLPRPFHAAELHATVHALMRRQPLSYVDDLIQIGDLEINTRKRQVRKSGMLIPLRRKEFDILLYLARNPGRTVSRNMIISQVWEVERESWDGTVDVHIMHLRNKIDRPFDTHFIKTNYGLGYALSDS